MNRLAVWPSIKTAFGTLLNVNRWLARPPESWRAQLRRQLVLTLVNKPFGKQQVSSLQVTPLYQI